MSKSKNEVIDVMYDGQRVGAAIYDTDSKECSFQYDPDFINTGIELSPVRMPLSDRVYSFNGLAPDAFHGLPGLLADSLPDDFGNAILNAWVAKHGRAPSSISPLERLQYTGKRGMGALEYRPSKERNEFNYNDDINIKELVTIAQKVLDEREELTVSINDDGNGDEDAMLTLLSVGTSAGGARPKAVLAFNDDFTEVRSGQGSIPDDFTHYLMKFDGVTEHSENKETFGDPLGYSPMEYVYYLMARQCGITMEPCKLLNEGPRRHFLTKRFDRLGSKKVHVQSLFAMQHVSHKKTGHYSYAELLMLAKELKLPKDDALQLLKRMIFNVVSRNHDDHSKNFAFLLNENHDWRLAPAFDLAYSYKPGSTWVDRHWMTLNGKRDDFVRKDFYSLESLSPIFTRSLVNEVLDSTIEVVSQWTFLARDQEVPNNLSNTISKNLRLNI